MSRRRYITTDISVDKNVKHLAMQAGDFAALLYTWMVPHADDQAILTGDPEEILDIVVPGRRDKEPEDVAAALDAMESLGLIERAGGKVGFPPEAFYRYQGYVKEAHRRTCPLAAWLERSSAGSGGEQRKPAETSGENLFPPKPAEISGPIPVPVPIPIPVTGKKTETREDALDVSRVLDEFNRVFAGVWTRPYRLTPKRERHIKARLAEFTFDDLAAAIANLRASKWHCGGNEHGRVYATPEFLFRSIEQVEQWRQQDGVGSPQPASDGLDWSGVAPEDAAVYRDSGRYRLTQAQVDVLKTRIGVDVVEVLDLGDEDDDQPP